MDPLKDDDLTAFELNELTIFAFSGFEIEMGQAHFFPRNQALQMFSQKGQVKRFERFEIIITILITRGIFTVYKEII